MMEPVALDSTKLAVIMAAGALFALAGLWLMIRPPAQGGSTSIELCGMKIQSASAGLLVFPVGALRTRRRANDQQLACRHIP